MRPDSLVPRVARLGLAAVAWLVGAPALAQPAPLDKLLFANAASEKAHQLASVQSETVAGGLQERARVLLPAAPASWEGGRLSFVMQVDPARPTYVTVRLWGSEANPNRLVLLCEGRQVGYRQLGDIDLLDIGTDAPLCNGRFFYTTLPLPFNLTKGKKQVHLTIQSNGPIWRYGQTWEQYQKPMLGPSRTLYCLYTHTEGAFAPPPSEKQGVAPALARRPQPGPEVLDRLRERLNREVGALLQSAKPLSQVQMQLLAKAYWVRWSVGYQRPELVQQVQRSLDALFVAYRQHPALAQADPATYNADWFGLGICGQVISLLQTPLAPGFDELVADGAGQRLPRRAALSEMLLACRDWHRQHRRQYTNQSMINDLYGIYFANQGVALLTPPQALPEPEARRYLYESVGLQPWLGSETATGPSRSAGPNYWQLTAQGLTKELGFVGSYGEVLDWMAEIYDATRPAPDQPGDEKIRAQLDKIALARMPFRYPAPDSAGYQAFRAETIVGWRDTHYPGDVTYVQRPSWDGGPLQAVAATRNPRLVGYAQQLLADNQLFETLAERMKDQSFRVTAGLLPVPDQYEALRALPPSPHRLPMTPGQPNFVWSDEEDGVVAVKNGREILYASLYWRARHAVNFLARVHLLTPTNDYLATVREEEAFAPSGQYYTLPDYTDFGFGTGGHPYPETVHSAHAGEQLPIAKIPADVPYKLGDENPYAGRASFYRLRYGRYLIGMNAAADKAYELQVPPGFAKAINLTTNKVVGPATATRVGPHSTVVLALP